MQKQHQSQPSLVARVARSDRATPEPTHQEHPLLQLQHTIGNQAVLRMMQVHAGEQEGRSGSPPDAGIIQKKLTINEPGDAFEQEADHIAEQVMRMPESQVQRSCTCGGTCPECQAKPSAHEQEHVQTKRIQTTNTEQTIAPPIVHQVLNSQGQPLDPETRAFMEPRFGHNFSQVQVHTGAAAEQSAREVHARAYTVGNNVVFGAGQFAPETSEGQRLLAHELTHVVQQSEAHRGSGPTLSNIVQRQPTQYYEKSESDVAESIIEVLQQPNHIAGLNVDPAFEILNPYPLSFQMRVLADLYDRNYFHGLLGYLASGTKANDKLIVAIRLTQCQRDPNLLTYEDVLEAQKFLKYYVTLPSELKPLSECLERERVRLFENNERMHSHYEAQQEEERQRRKKQQENNRFAAAFEPGSKSCTLKKGVMTWHLYPASPSGVAGQKQAIQIKFLPDLPYWGKTVTFLQTLHEEEKDNKVETIVDIGVNAEAFRPFYGADWSEVTRQWVPGGEGEERGFRSQPSSSDDPAAYMFDEPEFYPPRHGRVFESVAIVLETREILGALTWGVGNVPAYAQQPSCSDMASATFHNTMERFYTPKSPTAGYGRENYDLIFEGFAPNDATLTVEQKKQLDPIAADAKEIINKSKGDPKKEMKAKGSLVIGGFGDSVDTDPMAASVLRTQVVANYLLSKGAPKEILDLRPFGTAWALYEVNTSKAQEGRNRRVQIRLFRP
ncbi:hypothetical protein KSF_004040 [Reticulibacter mediterranei]|uniref:eCIS core domain-containing protein n=1 Tax=Reticulibacter mediterranei TaxID=2778369 RepID=A0A8J3I9F3_9CHLR|nr:DUF4157 domain-containing protein [Reticulibacter mediterranei]GHO90356.1 hypothetical protein KSF_004040 [Reticulibacter mediterranei]